jgi:hypothetical protein
MSDGREAPPDEPLPEDGDDREPVPAPPMGGPMAQRRVSNLLIFSILLSLVGGFMFPVVGPILGLVLAILGRNKVKLDPNLIGPRFAIVCIWFSVVLIPATGYLLYQSLRLQAFQQAISKAHITVFQAIEGDDYTAAWEGMSDEYRTRVGEEEFRKMWADVLPSGVSVHLSPEEPRNPIFREADIDPQQFRERVDAVVKETGHSETFTFPWILRAGDELIDMDFEVHVECLGYAEFAVRLDDLKLRVVPPDEQEPEKQPTDEPK